MGILHRLCATGLCCCTAMRPLRMHCCHRQRRTAVHPSVPTMNLDYTGFSNTESFNSWFRMAWGPMGPRGAIHHHYVPSEVNRSAVMDLHRSRSCATLIQSLYDIFVHSLMLSVHIVLGLPRPLLLFILPSISNRCIPSPLIICPKYWHFLFLIVFNNDNKVFILCKTSYLSLLSRPEWEEF